MGRREAIFAVLDGLAALPELECTTVSHERLKEDQAAWDASDLVGRQGDGAGGVLELRNCWRCGSTLARKASPPAAPAEAAP